MDLFDIAVARKLSSGGGGGSSDFSTATVTLNTSHGSYSCLLPLIADEGDRTGVIARMVEIIDEQPYIVPLYKGKMIMEYQYFYDIDPEVQPTITGNATMGEFGIEITGDCEIIVAGI